MKLKTKLAPIAGVGLIGVSLLPMSLSSCGRKTATDHSFDLVSNYYPTIERYQPETENLSAFDINQIYCAQLQRNLDTFTQDYYWSKSWTGIGFEQLLFWEKLLHDELGPDAKIYNGQPDRIIAGPANAVYTKDVELISHLSMSTQNILWESKTWTIPLLSFTLKFSSDVHSILLSEKQLDDDQLSGSVGGKVNGEISFYNVPFYIRSRSVLSEITSITNQVISFEPFYEWMSGQIESAPSIHWQIKTVVNSTINGEITYTTGTVQRITDDWIINVTADEKNPSWEYEELSLEKTIGCVFTNSYYLEKVRIGKEN